MKPSCNSTQRSMNVYFSFWNLFKVGIIAAIQPVFISLFWCEKQLNPEINHFMFNKNTTLHSLSSRFMATSTRKMSVTEATTRSGDTLKNKYCTHAWPHDNITSIRLDKYMICSYHHLSLPIFLFKNPSCIISPVSHHCSPVDKLILQRPGALTLAAFKNLSSWCINYERLCGH